MKSLKKIFFLKFGELKSSDKFYSANPKSNGSTNSGGIDL